MELGHAGRQAGRKRNEVPDRAAVPDRKRTVLGTLCSSTKTGLLRCRESGVTWSLQQQIRIDLSQSLPNDGDACRTILAQRPARISGVLAGCLAVDSVALPDSRRIKTGDAVTSRMACPSPTRILGWPQQAAPRRPSLASRSEMSSCWFPCAAPTPSRVTPRRNLNGAANSRRGCCGRCGRCGRYRLW
jgi:hypothetical protein